MELLDTHPLPGYLDLIAPMGISLVPAHTAPLIEQWLAPVRESGFVTAGQRVHAGLNLTTRHHSPLFGDRIGRGSYEVFARQAQYGEDRVSYCRAKSRFPDPEQVEEFITFKLLRAMLGDHIRGDTAIHFSIDIIGLQVLSAASSH